MKIDYLALQVNDAEELYFPYIAAGTELVLIDTGYLGMSEQIESKLAEKGSVWLM